MNNELENQLVSISNNLATKLLKCLATKSVKVKNKYEYYDADNDISDFGISTPIRMANSKPGIGWAGRAIHTISDRVVFDGFAKDTFGINDLFTNINAWAVINNTINDTYIAGCSFIAISDDENGEKMLIPFTAQEATGEVDQKTGLLKYGLAVMDWQYPEKKSRGIRFEPKDFVVFTPDFTAVFKSRTLLEIIPNPTKRCLMQQLTHRATADRPLGKSRLTNTARRIINEVGRLKRREEIAEEFYALPQRYINGLAQGAKKDPSLDSAIGKVWGITKDEDGEKPEIGQLPQMSIEGFIGAKKDKARDFCAETGLTLRNLGYETGNPSSPESLIAMSDDLLLEATNSQIELGEQIKQLAITLRMAIDGISEVPDQLKDLIPSWKPIFQVDIGSAGDAIFKLFQSMPELQGTMAGYKLLGIGVREAEELMNKRSSLQTNTFMNNGGAK